MSRPLFTGPEVIAVSTMHDGSEGVPYGSEGGREFGERVMQYINEALNQREEESRVRALGECVRRWPRETMRHPEAALYMQHLAKRRDTAAIDRILADRPRRGRPYRSAEEEFTETAIVMGIIEREGCSVRRAAEIARQEHPDTLGCKTVGAIQNGYARTQEVYRVACQPRWVPGDKLTDAPWRGDDRRRRRR